MAGDTLGALQHCSAAAAISEILAQGGNFKTVVLLPSFCSHSDEAMGCLLLLHLLPYTGSTLTPDP